MHGIFNVDRITEARLGPEIAFFPSSGRGAPSRVGTKKSQLWPKYRHHWVSAPICISLLSLPHASDLSTAPVGIPSPLVASRAKGTVHFRDLSTSQGGGGE